MGSVVLAGAVADNPAAAYVFAALTEKVEYSVFAVRPDMAMGDVVDVNPVADAPLNTVYVMGFVPMTELDSVNDKLAVVDPRMVRMGEVADNGEVAIVTVVMLEFPPAFVATRSTEYVVLVDIPPDN